MGSTAIGLLYHYLGTRSGWVVNSTPQKVYPTERDLISNLQEAGWAPGQVETGCIKSRPQRAVYTGQVESKFIMIIGCIYLRFSQEYCDKVTNNATQLGSFRCFEDIYYLHLQCPRTLK